MASTTTRRYAGGGGGGGHLGGGGGGVRGRRGTAALHHHAPTGAFGVGDDLGGGAASAARPVLGAAAVMMMTRVGGGGGGGGSDDGLVDWWGGGDDPPLNHLRGHYDCGATTTTPLARIRRACTVTVRGGAGLGGAAAAATTAAEGCDADGKGLKSDSDEDALKTRKNGGDSVAGPAGKASATTTDEETEETPVCRFCFEEADVTARGRARGGNLITPCACRGSQAYIHARCLRAWQNTATDGALRCQVCRQIFQTPPKTWRGRPRHHSLTPPPGSYEI